MRKPIAVPARRALALVGVLMLLACGKSSTTLPTQTRDQLMPPTTTVLVESVLSDLQPGFVFVVPFTTLGGTLDVVVDWTFATNDLDLLLTSGNNPCGLPGGGLDFSRCSAIAATSSATTKPETLSVPAQAAGTYTLYIANLGPGSESLSYRITQTSAGTGALGADQTGVAGVFVARAGAQGQPARLAPR